MNLVTRACLLPLAALLVAGCGPVPDYRLACYDNQSDRTSARECRASADAAIADVAHDGTVSAAAVWSFVECFPGAYCPLLAEAKSASLPMSAVVAIRYEDGEADIRIVNGVSAWWPMSTRVVGLGRPEDLVAAIFNTNGAMITP